MASAKIAKSLYRISAVNLPWTVGDLQLKQYFSQFGPISQATVLFDRNTGLSKHVGIVEIPDQETYQAIISKTAHSLEGMDFYVRKWQD